MEKENIDEFEKYQKQMISLLLKKIQKKSVFIVVCFLMFPQLVWAGAIRGFVATPETNSILLEWEKPVLSETQSVMVIRKEEACPKDIFDGEELYRGNGVNFIDKNVSLGMKYCYGAYVYDSLGMPLEMKTSGLVGTVSFWGYIGALFQENAVLTALVVIMIILNLLNIEKKRRFYRNQID
ncbi:MAG: hypothetical protein WCG73_02060 [Candidatus Moraniibacteriota bacterium]